MKNILIISFIVGISIIGLVIVLSNSPQNKSIEKESIILSNIDSSHFYNDTIKNVIKNKLNYFDLAINELEQMLSDKKPLSFKKAVFLTENAYYAGCLNWNEYNNEIERITQILNRMIVAKNLQRYKTAGNWAVFSFMSDSIPENNFEPYQYDFENFMSETDYESMMVSRLLVKKKGNCHALPYLYKILANEVGVEAFIATAPMHLYIKHKDEQGKWWNLEMTTGTFSRTSFIMESFNVSDAAMESGLFMKALTERESVALCILDLLNYYEKKTNIYSDSFVKKCYTIGLQFYPISLFQIWRANDLKFRLDSEMASLGIRDYKQIQSYPELTEKYNVIDSTFRYINKLGYSTISNEQYSQKVNEIVNKQSQLNEK